MWKRGAVMCSGLTKEIGAQYVVQEQGVKVVFSERIVCLISIPP